ncbi:MAG: cobyric acid synthase [Emcibacter sp.]|nr:cobyric acid synthase [Emcibacter sp.]MBL4893356.1 cobyric acid synthase [Emcibacter sp.]
MIPRLMIQGTGSDVGKSVLVAGLCRAFLHRGIRVRPFKPQNMSNNAAVTPDGGEIGRAQWLQAVACKILPNVHMNPVLIKPQSDSGAQIIVQGKVWGDWHARRFMDKKDDLLATVIESFDQLSVGADLIVVEGAGSPAEVNLRAGDIANMGFALPTKTPVVLVGDINRGGVIAALVGTYELLPAEERALIQGTIINKFRGDISLFDGGRRIISDHTHWPDFGVVPFLPCVRDLPAEDAVVLEEGPEKSGKRLKIIVPMLSRIANFDDLDPLRTQEDVDVIFHPPGSPLPGEADAVILPGTKATLADLRFLKNQGWDIDIKGLARRGTMILGLCGGYQMLGNIVRDPDGIEGVVGEETGLGLLDVETTLTANKQVRNITARLVVGDKPVTGYEIHAGRTDLLPGAKAFMTQGDRIIGAHKDRVMGSYLHGLFNDGVFLKYFLEQMSDHHRNIVPHMEKLDQALDQLAMSLEDCLDIDGLLAVSQTASENI